MYVAIDADAMQRHTRYQSDIFGAVVVLWVAIKNARMHACAATTRASTKRLSRQRSLAVRSDHYAQ